MTRHDKMKEGCINGEKLYLRPISAADTELMVGWRNQPQIMAISINRRPFDENGHRKWLATMVETGKAVQFIIVEKATARPIGSCYLRDIDQRQKAAQFGLFIAEADAQGQGFGTECSRLLMEHAFETLLLNRLYLYVLAKNTAAIRLYEKLGFCRAASQEIDTLPEGATEDVVLMSCSPTGKGKHPCY